MRFGAGHFEDKPSVGHMHHRQNPLFCQELQNPVDCRPAQSWSSAVYLSVHCFRRDVVTELTDGVQDELALGCYPVAGFAQLSTDICRYVGHNNFLCCEILQQRKL